MDGTGRAAQRVRDRQAGCLLIWECDMQLADLADVTIERRGAEVSLGNPTKVGSGHMLCLNFE